MKNVCDFQLQSLSALPKKFAKYSKFAKLAGANPDKPNHPAVVIPPYFPIQNSKWLEINLRLATIAKKYAGGLPVFPVISGRLEVLSGFGKALSHSYQELAVEGFFLWATASAANKAFGS